MKRFIFTLKPLTAFATPLHGDTLFGQCCWAIYHLHSKERLIKLLDGYCDNQPFMVLSDALPQGFIARPTVPTELLGFDTSDPEQRKQQKAKKWLPLSVLTQPLKQWATLAKTEHEMVDTFLSDDEKRDNKSKNKTPRYLINDQPQDHNSLNRQTGTTGGEEGVFAPFQRQTYCYHPAMQLNIVVELDETRLSIAELTDVLQWIGATGYGKEASCGLGKFSIEQITPAHPEPVEGCNAWLTLAACAPQGLTWHTQNCYYQTFTRFGRHGDLAVHLGSPFKNPVLLAAPFAVLTPKNADINQGFTGQGLDGLSKTIEATVQQGYAPVFPVYLELEP